jgi:hypothetical protein
MAKRRKSLTLAKLAEDSRIELEAMASELLKTKSEARDGSPLWTRRFAASGKSAPAAQIRNS